MKHKLFLAAYFRQPLFHKFRGAISSEGGGVKLVCYTSQPNADAPQTVDAFRPVDLGFEID